MCVCLHASVHVLCNVCVFACKRASVVQCVCVCMQASMCCVMCLFACKRACVCKQLHWGRLGVSLRV